MELINATKMVAGYTMGMEPSGRELLVVVVKGTFGIPERGGEAQLHPAQLPLITADTFTGEPGFTAPSQEVDFAPRKLRCDILLSGRAWAPKGEPAERVLVGARIGAWRKVFAVVGDRHWETGLRGARASKPLSFVSKLISYDLAFGGVDELHEDPDRHGAYMPNPVGRGWHCNLQAKYVDGAPLPNTEEANRPVDAPDGDFAPMSFGPVGRGWSSRLPYAGTYDQDWIDNTFPFLPADFQDAYYQAAPLDQQINHPSGLQDVALANITPRGHVKFSLPCHDMPVSFFRRGGGHERVNAVLDTIAFDTDKELVTLAWRATLPLKKSIFEISNVLAGNMSRGWWRARELGKTWYPSLRDLISSTRSETTGSES